MASWTDIDEIASRVFGAKFSIWYVEAWIGSAFVETCRKKRAWGMKSNVAGVSERFQARLSRRMPVWGRLVLAVVVILITLMAFDRRGWVTAIIAAVVFGAFAVFSWFDPIPYQRRAKRHRILDALPMIPLVFLMLAIWSSWSLWVCAGVGFATWLVMVMVVTLRFRDRSPS